MSRWISSKNTSKRTQNLRHDGTEVSSTQPWPPLRCPGLMRNSRIASKILCGASHCPHCGARALRPSSPKLLPPRRTSVTLLLTRRASARACRIGTMHMAKWAADSWAFHCSCCVTHCQLAVPHVWHKHTKGTCQDCHPCAVMSDPHVTIQPTHS